MVCMNIGSYVISNLNTELENKTYELKRRILHVADVITMIKNEGFEFLEGFKIAGKIYLEKELDQSNFLFRVLHLSFRITFS